MHNELQAVAETEIEFNLQNREALYTGGPEQHKTATVAATVAATPELRGIYGLTAGMQLYIGIGHISIMVTLMGGGISKKMLFLFFLFR